MKASHIHINELRIRATGLPKEQARHLGRLVADHLATLPVTAERSRLIPNLRLSVQSSTKSVEQIAHEVSRLIGRDLNSK